MTRKIKRMQEAPILSVWQSGNFIYPVFHRNRLNYDAYIADKRNTSGRREILFFRFFLYGDTFAERKAEFMENLEMMSGKAWCDYYNIMPHHEYYEFRRAFAEFCAKYARVFGLREYVEKTVRRLEFF